MLTYSAGKGLVCLDKCGGQIKTSEKERYQESFRRAEKRQEPLTNPETAEAPAPGSSAEIIAENGRQKASRNVSHLPPTPIPCVRRLSRLRPVSFAAAIRNHRRLRRAPQSP